MEIKQDQMTIDIKQSQEEKELFSYLATKLEDLQFQQDELKTMQTN